MKTLTLSSLASEINSAHAAAQQAAKTAVEHARACGELLIQAKAEVGHGGWQEWLKLNCSVGDRQARTYMRIARSWDAIAAKTEPTSDLTIKGAVGLLMKGTPIRELEDCVDRVRDELEAIHAELSNPKGIVEALWERHTALITAGKLLEAEAAMQRDLYAHVGRLLAREDEILKWLDEFSDATRTRLAELQEATG